MKTKFYLMLIICGAFQVSNAQITLSQNPNTPLTYLVTELTSPKVSSISNTESQFFGYDNFYFEIGKINTIKYTDISLCRYFYEKSDFFSYVESNTKVTRTEQSITYEVSAKGEETGDYGLYAKEIFYISNLKIDSISSTIYDTETNEIERISKFDVVYNANGKITNINLKSGSESPFLPFAGLYCEYNAEGLISKDTVYQLSYTNELEPRSYHEHFYNASNKLKIDSTNSYNVQYNPKHESIVKYELNANLEVNKKIVYLYQSDSESYERKSHYTYAKDPLVTGINKAQAQVLSTYPNPVTNDLFVSDKFIGAEYTISNVSGNVLATGVLDAKALDVNNLSEGVYFLTISHNNEVLTSRFIK